MEWKVKDKVTIKPYMDEGTLVSYKGVWTIMFIVKNNNTCIVEQGDSWHWVYLSELEPVESRKPRESRKQLKSRIKALEEHLANQPQLCPQNTMDCKVPLLETRCKELEEQNKELEKILDDIERDDDSLTNARFKIRFQHIEIEELKQKLAKAEEAIEIVEALERMPLGCGVWRTVVTNKWAYSMYQNGRDATEYYTTIKDALQAAGLMEIKEE